MTYPLLRFRRPLVVSPSRVALAALLVGVLVPRIAAAVQSAELYRSQTYFYGRFEARVRFAPGEGVVSSFFLWKDRPTSSTPWNELDFEKINSDCRLQTNIWTGTGTQNKMLNTPSFNICSDYHTYGIEWTPDYIAWFIDGAQVRKVTGASVTEYTQNASGGMAIHFNIWQGDSSFGGNLDTSILPVYQYISWAQYSSYANGAFQLQWREEFTGSTTPSGWLLGNWLAPLNHSMHNMANAKFVNGIAVLALTNDNATGYTGTPPADPASGGTSGTGGTGGSGAGGAGTGAAGRGGTVGSGGMSGAGGRGGTGGGASAGTGGASSGGNSASGSAGNGAGGTTAGVAGNGGGGTTAGAAGSGAGGVTAGTGGDTVGPGSGGAVGTGGTSTTGAAGTGQNPSGTGGGAVAGQAGSTGQTGGDSGCSCDVGSAGGGGSITALLLLGALARVRRRFGRPGTMLKR